MASELERAEAIRQARRDLPTAEYKPFPEPPSKQVRQGVEIIRGALVSLVAAADEMAAHSSAPALHNPNRLQAAFAAGHIRLARDTRLQHRYRPAVRTTSRRSLPVQRPRGSRLRRRARSPSRPGDDPEPELTAAALVEGVAA
jgi:hypothetical protein